MPFEVSQQGSVAIVRLFGTLTKRDVLMLAEAAERLDKLGEAGGDRVLDLTQLEHIEWGYRELQPVAERRRLQPLSCHVRTALIAREPLHIGYARMFQMLNSNPKIELRVVGGMDEALVWFAEPRNPHAT